MSNEPAELSGADLDLVAAGSGLTIITQLNINVAAVDSNGLAIGVGGGAFALGGSTLQWGLNAAVLRFHR